jgi:hypothetical protein
MNRADLVAARAAELSAPVACEKGIDGSGPWGHAHGGPPEVRELAYGPEPPSSLAERAVREAPEADARDGCP